MDKAGLSVWFLNRFNRIFYYFSFGSCKSIFQITVGVDIAKKNFDVALLMESKYKHKHFSNDNAGFEAFIAWLLTFNLSTQPLICMEATGAYSLPLAKFLVVKGYLVSVVNPAKTNAFANTLGDTRSELGRTKTDNTRGARGLTPSSLPVTPCPCSPPCGHRRQPGCAAYSP